MASYFDLPPLPNTLVFTDAYRNVSNQTLEVDWSVNYGPGHVWYPMADQRYLSQDQTSNRSRSTQLLIDRGYITKFPYIPVIPQGFLYLQSVGGIWMQVYAHESITNAADNRGNSVGYELRVAESEPQPSWVINFNLVVPYNAYFSCQFDSLYLNANGSWDNQGIQHDDTISMKVTSTADTLVYERRPKGSYQPIVVPLAIPNTSALVFQTKTKGAVRVQVSDEGQFVLTPV